MKLSDREVAVLAVLAEDGPDQERGLYATRVGALAGFDQQGRHGSGTTRTLDALSAKKLVRGEYLRSSLFGADTARRWWITSVGREALGEYAFGE